VFFVPFHILLGFSGYESGNAGRWWSKWNFELGELWEGLSERERKLLDGTGFPLNDESCAR